MVGTFDDKYPDVFPVSVFDFGQANVVFLVGSHCAKSAAAVCYPAPGEHVAVVSPGHSAAGIRHLNVRGGNRNLARRFTI